GPTLWWGLRPGRRASGNGTQIPDLLFREDGGLVTEEARDVALGEDRDAVGAVVDGDVRSVRAGEEHQARAHGDLEVRVRGEEGTRTLRRKLGVAQVGDLGVAHGHGVAVHVDVPRRLFPGNHREDAGGGDDQVVDR